MRITVLGCSGGIGDGKHTTSLLIDDDVLVDAGSGVLTLSTEQLKAIDHIFITHSHLDHILSLPLMLDSVGYRREMPVTAHGIEAVLQTLHCNVFNWCVWPDFCRIPSADMPYLIMQPIEIGEEYSLPGGRSIRPLPANHVVPAAGYHLRAEGGSLVFSGDTAHCAEFWEAVNAIDDLRYIIIETAFGNEERGVAEVSKHFCPATLAESLASFRGDAEIFITHLKPGQEDRIMGQIENLHERHRPRRLEQGQRFLL